MSVMSVMTLKFQHSMPFVISVAAQLESDTRGEQLRTNKMIKCTLLKYKQLGLRFPERDFALIFYSEKRLDLRPQLG